MENLRKVMKTQQKSMKIQIKFLENLLHFRKIYENIKNLVESLEFLYKHSKNLLKFIKVRKNTAKNLSKSMKT